MAKIKMTWTDLKAAKALKNSLFQYEDQGDQYKVWFEDESINYHTYIEKEDPKSADQIDFEDNYMADCNKAVRPTAPDGKQIMLSSSRPEGTTAYFTSAGDDTDIGNGNEMTWDFSNSDDEVTAPSGFKRKRIVLSFMDDFWVKEGTVYFFNAPKGQYVDFYVVCPAGQYYINNAGVPTLASVDTPIVHYVNKHFMQGDCPVGDEMNTEAATLDSIPKEYVFWVEVTTPDTDNTSNGHSQLELYRERSVIL